jgi:hypothetical protein
VLTADSDKADARAVGIEAHEQLLHVTENFWEKAWLNHAIDELRTTS